MKTVTKLPLRLAFAPLAGAVLALTWPAAAPAQTAPRTPTPAQVAAAADARRSDEVVELTAFEVRADSDRSYGALNSNSITRFSTELDRMPVSADVFNEAFMKDVAAVSVEDMVISFSAGAGSAIASPGPSAANNQPGDRNANSFVALRGLTAPTMQRDGFMPVNTYIQSGSTGTGYSSNYNIERVEVINGPQSLLYGVGGAGGVMNIISKQARFGKKPFGSFQFQVDQYGHKLGLLDLGMGHDKIAIRVVATDQYAQGSRRLFIGGPMNGLYVQLAAKLGRTVVRVNAERSEYDRMVGTSNQAFTAVSAANDARNGQRLRFLLATGQINAAATGASGAGVIANGKLTWDNIDSFASWWNTSEYTKTGIVSGTADTKWNRWLTTQVALGYRSTFDSRVGNTITFAAPNLATNPTGTWAVGMTGGIPANDLVQPARQKAIRASALITNELFGGRVHSQSIIGADFVRTDGAVITYAYVKADANWNPIIGTKGTTAAAPPTGHQYAPQLWWPISDGPVRRPLWQPRRATRVTYAGQNYVRIMTNPPYRDLITPQNPEGLLPGGINVLGDYRVGQTQTKGVYAANYTNWLDGKLDLLLGARVGNSYSMQMTESAPPSPPSTLSRLDSDAVSFNVGANYAVTNSIRTYVSASDAYNPPPIYVAGPMGDYPVSSHGVGVEAGVKVSNAAKTVSGSLAIYHANSKNEESSLTSTLLFSINPSGLNGLYNAPSVWINVDRKTQGLQATVTATPTSNWRMRFSGALTDGQIGSDRSFPALYNDQFYANASGQVTYRDGSPVYVANTTAGSATPVASTTANAIPLTITMMNTPGNAYYANPLAVTGAINRSSVVGRVLQVTDAVRGPILTSATGLPISAIQINPGFKPAGTIVTNVAGEKSTGYAKYSMVFTNHYTFSEGWLKNVSIGGTVSLGWQYRHYYFYPNGLADPNNSPRELFMWPTQARFDGLLGYRRKIGKRYEFATQLNVANMFNRYHVLLLPNFTTGWTGVRDATFDQQPRTWVWSSTVSF
ncbi:MAG: TonB-dependent receptor plug domain-containing protein [Verrucomicrobia bacterium]|nr:TonB-dependent receptor plug domain-containing protein [Verrucomicrobiota bacterium]